MAKSSSFSFVTLVFGLIFLIAGYLVAFKFGAPILENAKASEQWPKASGRITASHVETSRDSENKNMYSAQVTYEYEVEGTTYTDDTVWFGGDYSSSNRSDAQQTVSKYPAGQTVDVYYQPDDPANAVLEPGAKFTSYLVYGIGWMILLVGILILGGMLIGMVRATRGVGSQKSGPIESPTGKSSESGGDDFVENL